MLFGSVPQIASVTVVADLYRSVDERGTVGMQLFLRRAGAAMSRIRDRNGIADRSQNATSSSSSP